MTKFLFVSAGHGLSESGKTDSGANFGDITERAEVVEAATELCERLVKHSAFTPYKLEEDADKKLAGDADYKQIKRPRKIQVVRVGIDEAMTLRDKVQMINDICDMHSVKNGDAYAIDLHMNSAGRNASGVETWYNGGERNSKQFAKTIQEALVSSTGFRNRGIKNDEKNRHGRLGFVSDTRAISVLPELGFITNDLDARLIRDPEADDALAEGLYNAILTTLELVDEQPTPPDWYEDVPVDSWYYPHLKLCVDEGYFVIPDNGLFKPSEARVTQAVVMARHLVAEHGKTLPS